MSDDSSDKKPALLLAEFDTAKDVVHAAEKVRDAGYKNWDTHTPFPIHGMDKAMGLGQSKLGAIVFPAAMTGTTLAFFMIWWMNGVDYPLIIGGKPGFSLPSQIPIMFEVTVLFSAFSTVFGMLHLNRLPRHHHPIFNSERFSASTDHKYFVSIEAEDPKFDLEKTKKLLEQCHATSIEVVFDDNEGDMPSEEEEHG
jgi:hypothetical protein